MKTFLLAVLTLAPALPAAAADVSKAVQWRFVDVAFNPASPDSTTTLFCRHPNLEQTVQPLSGHLRAYPGTKVDCYYWKPVQRESLVDAKVGAVSGKACARDAVRFGELLADGDAGKLKLKAATKEYAARERHNVRPDCRGGDFFSVTRSADVSESVGGGGATAPGVVSGGLHDLYHVFRFGLNGNPYGAVLVPKRPAPPAEGTASAYVVKTLQHDARVRFSGLLEPFNGTVTMLATPGSPRRSATVTFGGKDHAVNECSVNERCIETIPTGHGAYIAMNVAFAYVGLSRPGAPPPSDVRRRQPIPDSEWLEKVTPAVKWSMVKAKGTPHDRLKGNFWCYHPDLDGTKTLAGLIARDNGPAALTCVDWNPVGDGKPLTEAGKTYLLQRFLKKISVRLEKGKLEMFQAPAVAEASETPNRPVAPPLPGYVKVTARGAVAPAPPGPVAGQPRTDPRNTLDWRLFGEAMTMADGGESPQKERTWLTFAEYAAHKSPCYNEDKPACRTAVAAARQRVLSNLREGGDIAGKKYKDYYRAAIAKRGDPRATDINALLYLSLGDEYGTKSRVYEVSLTETEKRALTAAPAGAVTTTKTGAVLLAEYEAELGKLETADHVARHIVTEKYRREVPKGTTGPVVVAPPVVVSPPALPEDRLTDEELARLRRLSPERAAAYEQSMRSPSEAARRRAVQDARDWLADHPETVADFDRLDLAARNRICDKWNAETAGGTTGAPAGPGADPATGALDQARGAQRQATTGQPAGVIDGQRTTAAPPAAGYRWPADIVAKCRALIAGRNPAPRVDPNPQQQPPTPGNIGARPIGRPPEDKTSGKKEALTAWNPLLNGAKGAVLGGIIGFVLGGPLGMLVGAAVFGAAGWGLSKIDNA